MKETFFMSLSPVVVAQGKRMAHGDVPGTGEELFLTDIQQGFKLETILAALHVPAFGIVIGGLHDDGGDTLTEIGSNRFRGNALGSSVSSDVWIRSR
jgi:hypothetical protein